MRSKRVRITSLFVVLAATLVVSGLVTPGAFGLEGYEAAFTFDPSDAIKGQTITSEPFDQGGTPVAVEVTPPIEESASGLTVTLSFATGSGLASTENIGGNVATTDEFGVATFDELTIADANEPTLTNYQLIAEVTQPEITIAGVAFASEAPLSQPFDVWDAGDSCGEDETCQVVLRGGTETGGADTYKLFEPGTLGASEFGVSNFTFSCPGQRRIFGNVFTNMTTDAVTPGTPAPVFLENKITAGDFRSAGTNFGRAHVDWCIALDSNGPWLKNGGSFRSVTIGGQPFFVGLAPKCPNKKTAPSFAPCILSRMSDGIGGAIVTGWLPGGDPPRRT